MTSSRRGPRDSGAAAIKSNAARIARQGNLKLPILPPLLRRGSWFRRLMTPICCFSLTAVIGFEALSADGHWDAAQETHVRRRGVVLHRVVPRGVVMRAGVLHQIAREIDSIRHGHADAAVRCGVADR